VLRSDNLGGYVLDAYGALHQFGNAPGLSGSVYWGGWDIARSLALTSDSGGYVLDGYGGLHPFGTATSLSSSPPYWGGWDIARSLVIVDNGTGGYTLDGWGGVHPFGSATALSGNGYWPGSNNGKAIAVTNADTLGAEVDAAGVVWNLATTTPPTTTPPTTTPPTGTTLTLQASPVSVAGGGAVVVTWSGFNPSGNDWISMHPIGAPDTDLSGATSGSWP